LITLLWPVAVLADQDTQAVVAQAVCLPDHRLLLLHKRMRLLPVLVEPPVLILEWAQAAQTQSFRQLPQLAEVVEPQDLQT
jgi:hypothetical protein